MRRRRQFPQGTPDNIRSSILTGGRPAPWFAVFLLALVPLIFGTSLALANPSNTILPDIGASLVGGAIIGLVFAFVQYTMAQRNQLQDKDVDLRLLLTSSSNLPGIDLSHRALAGVYLRGKSLESARLNGADLTGAVLDGTNFSAANLTGADLSRATMKAAKLIRARMSTCTLTDADLTDADLRGAVLRGAVLDRADVFRAQLSGADLGGASLEFTNLDEAQLDGAQLGHVRAASVRLAGAKLPGAALHFADLGGAHLARADLTGAQLIGANLTEAVLIRADLSGADLTGVSLVRADLTGCRLAGAIVRSADLSGAVLGGCDLRGADLTGARLTGVQGRDSARSDAHTRWPEDTPAGPVPQTAAEGWTGVRRVLVVPDTSRAAEPVRQIAGELARQQSMSRRVEGVRMSLPLAVRPPRSLRISLGRVSPRLRSVATVRVGVTDAAITATVTFRGRTCVLPPVPLDRDPDPALELTAIDEVAARILDVTDPRDGAPWYARACVTAANRLWVAEGRPAIDRCRRILLAARLTDRRSPVVNYALGALGYNEYDGEPTKASREYFAVAYVAAVRLGPDMEGLVGLCLTGTALANCQLYHRFGMDTPDVLAAGRSAAANAVSRTRERLVRGGLSRRTHRNAMEGYALARYAQAFAQHVTEEEDDVRSSIPIYQDAINTLLDVGAPVPAVLYNNLGYQHMTVAGLKERGSDATSYRTARKLFVDSLEVHPELHFGWANLGNVDRLLGNPAAAEQSYRRALEIVAADGGRYPQGWNELACVLLELGGRDDEAWAAHRQAVADGSAPAVRARLRAEFASRLILVGHPDEAAEVAREGLAEDPDNRYCRRALEEAQSAS
ncbi:uncharacterized protein YjbI with pentapeptide repeats/tetratricopeptide (TPR) repeat protein [Actinoplanes lutulentus]|uniref:Uncharacterized protein YjbI with pentapeptide repeats n=1 Tax=Actinoplanes lutulentus TaxID=1287878 RepID=A0A327Z043_9ACTN|nr:pentapeptide repeat-containing protein [Actinoplanes lutulentus]MBB2943607.1 uncharacterized protein YjbI with pentapeptide repeats/tetratricopeptide (TPR) repeat protein [Actinoplanes lutulentus]RAK27472.1 uncharacterized protein YjbI with pentapeptide repeats [Actinoplanes lutulentus]